VSDQAPAPPSPPVPGDPTEAGARRAGDPADEVLADGDAGGPLPSGHTAPERVAERDHRPVLVVDFGAQYAQLIARRVREARIYSEIVPHSMPVPQMLRRDPAAIILSGGPSSVYADGAPQVDPALFDAGVPVLGICYGFQAMARALGG
jgi:GMP synthase (glutamine-hydrolysing)